MIHVLDYDDNRPRTLGNQRNVKENKTGSLGHDEATETDR